MFQEVSIPPPVTIVRPLDLAGALRALRLVSAESMAETAVRLAVSKRRLEEIERGLACPTDEQAAKWGAAYNLDPDLFVRYAARLRQRLSIPKGEAEVML